jgi:Family of unknown function (DUF6325)
MTETQEELDRLGPVDYLIIEFPAGKQNFTGQVAEQLVKLTDAGTIRVIDLVILATDEAGNVEAVEISGTDGLGDIVKREAQLAELLAAEDIVQFGAGMAPGSVAGVLVFENLWAAPLAAAARHAGGQLVAGGRVPIQALIASLEADGTLERSGA